MKPDWCFEVSWEVCNKVGGIYTVLMSKANQMIAQYGKGYVCIGPYFHDKALGEFEENVIPEEFKVINEELLKQGISCHFGKWLIKGEPNVILIDFTNFRQVTNAIKSQLWENFKIDSLNAPGDFNDPIVWSWAVGMLLELLAKMNEGQKIVAQFHEWLSGAGLLYCKRNQVPIKTVFTTHATVLGRSIAGANVDLYAVLDKLDPNKEAYDYGVAAKHQLESQSAKQASVFTTVSAITGDEATKLLGRKPDVLLPNGLDISMFPTFEDASIQHQKFKHRIKEFVLYYFFPHYNMDLDETLLFFTFARYEFQNKGLDVTIKALAKLNNELKNNNVPRSVIMFFFIPTNVRGIRAELVEHKRYYEDIKESVENRIESIRSRLIYFICAERMQDKTSFFEADFMTEIKKKLLRFKKNGHPSLITHDLAYDESQDPIITSLRHHGLNNGREDKVKVVFYPTYLSGADGLIDLSYYEAISGCHLGVFPSKYEPWGYTPLEAATLGVAAVTTDLSGFGRYICNKCTLSKTPGVWVVDRAGKNDEECVDSLSKIFYHYATLSKQERIENKIEARKVANMADWQSLIKFYVEAHELAMDK